LSLALKKRRSASEIVMQNPVKERIAKLRDEIAQISEANRLYIRGGKKMSGSVGEHERRLQRLPEFLGHVQNVREFWAVLAFDKWTCNSDGRQAAFWKGLREKHYTAAFIDQGYCFNGGEWSLVDGILRGVYAFNEIYTGVRDWDSFEPALSGIETMSKDMVQYAATAIPAAWYGGDWRALQHLALLLHERRNEVRGAINAFRLSRRQPFPNWEEDQQICLNQSVT
jgi:hypothetical protein